MPIDTSSYADAAGPSRSLADYQQQYQGIAQNALNLQMARQTIDAKAQDQAEKASLRNYLSGAPDLSSAQGYNGLMAAAPTLGPGIHKTYQEGLTSAAKAALDNAQATSAGVNDAKTRQTTADMAFAHYQNALGTVQTPEEAARFITASYHDPVIGPELQKHGTLDDGLALLSKLSATPEGFQQWLGHASAGLEKMAAAAKTQQIDTGGATRTQVYQPYTGQVSTVATAPKTATPGEVLSNGIAGARLTEERRHNTATEGLESGKAAVAAAAIPKLNEGQGKATTFAARMADAESTIQSLESKGVSGSDMRTIAAGHGLTNWAASSDGQDYRQAQENWVTANLRQESGAAIGKDEMDKDVRKFFPAPGDGESVKAQKARARSVAQQGMLVQAGPGAAQVPGILQKAGASAAPASGGNTVQTPDGQIHTFPDAAKAAAFKKAAGL